MKRLWMALAGAALLCAGCPVVDDISTPEWKAYGEVKADFALDSSETGPAGGDYVMGVPQGNNDGNLTVNVRDSRFGAKLEMGAVTGRVEVDFRGDDETNTAGDILLRHAYVALDLGNDMRLLAGQTSDVFAPLNPYTLNWPVGWFAGNVGHRSPQFRFEYTPDMGPVDVQVALSDPQDDNMSMPDIQARVGFKLKETVDLGASIVIGSTDIGNGGEEDIFGLAVDVNAKLGERVSVKGEWHTGQNLDGYMGSIGMPIPNNDEIGTDGFWWSLVFNPTDLLTVNTGMTVAMNDDGDIAADDPESNTSIFGNVIFHLNENTDVGIEVSRWETEYKGDPEDYDNLRIQGSVIVRF